MARMQRMARWSRSGGPMGPTIRDVARAAGVSIATVSRGLAGSATVAAATRERVQRAATELGYRSEEHTSELQSRFDLVCRLLLEKKKTRIAVQWSVVQ